MRLLGVLSVLFELADDSGSVQVAALAAPTGASAKSVKRWLGELSELGLVEVRGRAAQILRPLPSVEAYKQRNTRPLGKTSAMSSSTKGAGGGSSHSEQRSAASTSEQEARGKGGGGGSGRPPSQPPSLLGARIFKHVERFLGTDREVQARLGALANEHGEKDVTRWVFDCIKDARRRHTSGSGVAPLLRLILIEDPFPVAAIKPKKKGPTSKPWKRDESNLPGDSSCKWCGGTGHLCDKGGAIPDGAEWFMENPYSESNYYQCACVANRGAQ